MAKYSNVFKEASRRYKDMKARGFIPEGSKYAFQDFVNEVAAENKGEEYKGAYTAKAYERAYKTDVDYYEGKTYQDVKEDREEDLVAKYRNQIEELFHTNDFWELSEKYGDEFGLDPRSIYAADTLSELISLLNAAMGAQPYLFRNKYGRNRQEESGMMETYQNDFYEAAGILGQEITHEKNRYRVAR